MLTIWGSRILYLCIIAVCTITAYWATITKEYKQKLCIFFIILVLSLLLGFRGNNTGLDTNNYYRIFENIRIGNYSEIYMRETTFLYITKGLFYIFQTTNNVMIFYSFIIVSLSILGFWSLREYINFPITIVCFLTLNYYFVAFNLFRQWIAISIIIFTLKYLVNGKYWKYLLACIVATLFHISAIMAIINFIVFYFTKNKNDSQKIVAFLLLLIPIGIVMGLFLLNKYDNFLEKITFDFSIFLCIKLVLWWISRVADCKITDENENAISWIYLIGILLTYLGCFYEFADRIGLFSMLIEPIYIGMYFKKHGNHRLMPFYVFISIWYLVSMLYNLQKSMLIYSVFWLV